MTATKPEPAPAPETPVTHETLGARLRDWFAKDIEPRVQLAETDIDKGAKALAVALGSIPRMAALVTSLAKVVDPAAGPAVAAIVADAEKLAGEAASAAAELGAKL